MGTVQIDGSTPKITVGNATAEDATILFDGNAQDFYIALDDSADDLLIGLGSTVGTTPIIAIDENKLSTFSGAITVGVDDTGHDVKLFGATAGSFLLWDESSDSLELTDSTPIQIGDAQDLTLYHDGSHSYITNKTGTMKLATETSGIAVTIGHTTSEVTIADNLTVTGTVTLADGSLALADLDIDGGTDIGAAIVDADLFIIDDGAGGTNRKTAASRLKTYIGGEATNEIDNFSYNATTATTGGVLTTNWVRSTGGWSIPVGTGMTVDNANGEFTFPSTGHWQMNYQAVATAQNAMNYWTIGITTSTDDFSSQVSHITSNHHIERVGNAQYHLHAMCIFDVIDVANYKVLFDVNFGGSDTNTIIGATAGSYTSVTFVRLADTQRE